MPTLTWILESAQDRYWEGMSQTMTGPPPTIPCLFCNQRFSNQADLLLHLGIAHPLGMPILLLANRPVARELVVRQEPRPTDFLVHNCTDCTVVVSDNELQIEPSELPNWLCEKRPIHAEVKLRNTRSPDDRTACCSYRVEFRIAAKETLDESDRLFVEKMVVPQPTMSDVDAFRRAIPTDPASREYAGALADYVVGILLKEQARDRGIQGSFDTYEHKFMIALGILKDFPRRIANVVSTVIEFNLNAWDCINIPKQLPDLSRAVEFFRTLPETPNCLGRGETVLGEERPICPMDIVTERIVHAIKGLLLFGRSAQEDLFDELAVLQSRIPFGEYDLVKMHVIAAVSCLWSNTPRSALAHLRHIQFDKRFGDWAKNKLEEINNYE